LADFLLLILYYSMYEKAKIVKSGEIPHPPFTPLIMNAGKPLGRRRASSTRLRMKPTQLKKFRVHRVSQADVLWLRDMLSREGNRFGTNADIVEDATLILRWR
jgi:hypothetical protein